jgi:putative hydrolase of the HAD superfamily
MGDKMLPKAILFDLDDTIISFDGVADYAWEKICKSFIESEKTSFNVIELLENISKARKWYWSDSERHKIGRMDMIKARREIVKVALNELYFFDEDKAYKMADNYSKLHEELICLFPKSMETLEKLSSLGVRMVLITNGTSEKQRGKINRFCLSGFFQYCFIEEEIGFGKPDTRIYEMALQKLNLKAEEVWMVGDNLVWDVEAPKKVGIFAIWNDFRRKGLPKDSTIIPDMIISDISELI